MILRAFNPLYDYYQLYFCIDGHLLFNSTNTKKLKICKKNSKKVLTTKIKFSILSKSKETGA